MARTIREWPTSWLQPDGMLESENRVGVPPLGEQEDVKDGRVIVDYKLDKDYETQGMDPNDKPVAQEEEKVYSQ